MMPVLISRSPQQVLKSAVTAGFTGECAGPESEGMSPSTPFPFKVGRIVAVEVMAAWDQFGAMVDPRGTKRWTDSRNLLDTNWRPSA